MLKIIIIAIIVSMFISSCDYIPRSHKNKIEQRCKELDREMSEMGYPKTSNQICIKQQEELYKDGKPNLAFFTLDELVTLEADKSRSLPQNFLKTVCKNPVNAVIPLFVGMTEGKTEEELLKVIQVTTDHELQSGADELSTGFTAILLKKALYEIFHNKRGLMEVLEITKKDCEGLYISAMGVYDE